MEPSDTNPLLSKAILEVVDNQLREGDPPEARLTYDRLQKEGFESDDARRLIGMVVAVEIYNVIKHRESFNRDRLVWNLHRLPLEPWDEKGQLLYKAK